MNLANVPVELRPSQGWAGYGLKLEEGYATINPETSALEKALRAVGGHGPVPVVLTFFAEEVKATGYDVEAIFATAVKDELAVGPPDEDDDELERRQQDEDPGVSFYRLPTG